MSIEELQDRVDRLETGLLLALTCLSSLTDEPQEKTAAMAKFIHVKHTKNLGITEEEFTTGDSEALMARMERFSGKEVANED